MSGRDHIEPPLPADDMRILRETLERRTLLAALPIVCCPHCEAEQQLDDYYDLQAGSSFECQHCQKEIHVLSTDTVFYARLSTETES